MTKKFSEQLLGRILWRGIEHCWPQGSDWPANVTGEYIAIIEASWLDSEGSIKVAIRNPMTDAVAEVWLTHHKLKAKSE